MNHSEQLDPLFHPENAVCRLLGKQLLDSEFIDFVGRTHYADQKVYFFYTASGFEVHFWGTSLSARLFSTWSSNAIRRPYLSVFVDGETDPFGAEIIALAQSNQKVLLAEGLSAGFHAIRVGKRSESNQSATALCELWTDGHFLPILPIRRPKLEFIGDSLTSGFGNLGTSGAEAFRTETEDGMLSYASLTARMLDARFHIVSVSGIGLYKSPYADIDMTQVYPKIDLNKKTRWDFTRFCPDAVLINLGANDDVYIRSLAIAERPAEIEAFRLAFVAFIGIVRQKNPQAFIGILVIPSWLPNLKTTLEGLVETLRASGERRIAVMEIGSGLVSDGMGSSCHPTYRTHIRQAEELTAAIEKCLGITRKIPNLVIQS